MPVTLLGELAESVCDGPVTLHRDVLVNQGGPRGGVPHAGHEIPKGGTRLGGEGVSGVAKIMEVKSAESRLLERRRPDSGEIRAPEFGALGADETCPCSPFSAYVSMCLRRSGSRVAGC